MNAGFEPVVDEHCLVLILGSFPSVKSREINFYYGNKQNRIWKTLGEYFDENVVDNKEEKIKFLLKNHVALWDIVKSSNIKGSGDSELLKKVDEINDIEKLLQKYPNIKKVFCNGKASEILLKKYFPNIDYIYLPSTSPANVSFSKQVWFENLDKIFKI